MARLPGLDEVARSKNGRAHCCNNNKTRKICSKKCEWDRSGFWVFIRHCFENSRDVLILDQIDLLTHDFALFQLCVFAGRGPILPVSAAPGCEGRVEVLAGGVGVAAGQPDDHGQDASADWTVAQEGDQKPGFGKAQS